MFKNLFKKNSVDTTLYAFVDGTAVDLSEVKDEVFSQKILGEGIAIKPTSNKVLSPCDGEIVTVMKDSKHAVAIQTRDNLEVLIHIGLDTVNLKGEGFELHCDQGDKVKKGDLLITFDRDGLEAKGIDDTSMLVITGDNGHTVEKYYTNETVTAGQSKLIDYK